MEESNSLKRRTDLESKKEVAAEVSGGDRCFKTSVIVLLTLLMMLLTLACVLLLALFAQTPDGQHKVNEDSRHAYRLNPSFSSDINGVTDNVATLLDHVGEPIASETVFSTLHSLLSKVDSLGGGAPDLSKLDTIITKLDALDTEVDPVAGIPAL